MGCEFFVFKYFKEISKFGGLICNCFWVMIDYFYFFRFMFNLFFIRISYLEIDLVMLVNRIIKLDFYLCVWSF